MKSIANHFGKSKSIKGLDFANSICINPMEGTDALADGTPGILTRERYAAFAESGAGLIWGEAVAVSPECRASANQLMLTEENADSFSELIAAIKKINPMVKLICQLTHSGRFSKPEGTPRPLAAMRDPYLDGRYPVHTGFEPVSDEYLAAVPQLFYKSAKLCKSAGFDGVDIKACHRYLVGELLAAYTRPGNYGGSFKNRTRLLRDIFTAIEPLAEDDFILCSRFGIYDAIAYPYGFGVGRGGEPDYGEPIELLKILQKSGLSLVNITMGTPYYNAHINKPHKSPAYDPESSVDNLLRGASLIKAACPDLYVVSTGFSYLKERAFERGNQLLGAGGADFIGFGRLAFAHKTFAREILSGKLDAKNCCVACNK
ncbi:MAG: flavin oxidoreductase/NADH oxidase, partial [Clostridiales bacterium]|nr:flavin oxidoreductase/NADH oxidase [Clostridiales bacterium]